METEALTAASEIDFSVLALYLRATFTVKIVMLMLIFSSIWSWSIIIQKFINYRKARKNAHLFDKAFWSGAPLDNGLTFLATVGSTAPFIGLFGTVWGIKNAFEEIAIQQNTNLAVVAPGIAEALVATALGLLAAIPAVIFYNKLSADADRLVGGYESFADEFSTILSRQLDS